MNKIIVICPHKRSDVLNEMIKSAVLNVPYEIIEAAGSIDNLQKQKILFALELNITGACFEMLELLDTMCSKTPDAFINSTAALLVHSSTALYTKSAAQNFIFTANKFGCRFIGHPLVEAVYDFSNFITWKKTLNMGLYDICLSLCKKLGKRLYEYNPVKITNPKILALHSSSNKTSNTLELWHMAKKNLIGYDIKELNVENGTIMDCKGCSFKTCLHFSRQNSCFYGGVMVEEIMPAIEYCDAAVFICPNYNDSVSANLSAVINRTTALYRKISFYNKTLFSVIVSGNSGGDSVAKQLIGALNINKGFSLPPGFALMATANDPRAVEKIYGIEQKAKVFADSILNEILINNN